MKLRILGSGFTEEEYRMYGLGQLEDPDDAMRYLSNRRNHEVYRAVINPGAQQHTLEDKWLTHLILSRLGVPVPETFGLYHPVFGSAADGAPMRTAEEVAEVLRPHLPRRLILKPRGGRKGRHVIRVDVRSESDGSVTVSREGKELGLGAFLADLPGDAFTDFDGTYHGWLVQECLVQHHFLNRFNPDAINTMRVVTFINADDQIRVHLAALRLGRPGSVADNWDRGGLSVGIDVETGRLGRGVPKLQYGGEWTSAHPGTGARFEGEHLPHWDEVVRVCRQAAGAFSGVRAIGWDAALTPSGPVIVEANGDWGLPSVQIHTRGYLTDEVRAELARFGAHFPTRLRPLPQALVGVAARQWRRSRGPRVVAAWRARFRDAARRLLDPA